MSMINFYENRGGKNIPASQKKVLDKSKDELRKLYGREEKKLNKALIIYDGFFHNVPTISLRQNLFSNHAPQYGHGFRRFECYHIQ